MKAKTNCLYGYGVVAYLSVFAASLLMCVCAYACNDEHCKGYGSLALAVCGCHRVFSIPIRCPTVHFHLHHFVFVSWSTFLFPSLSLSLSLSLPTEKFYFHNLKLLAIRSAFSGWNWKANIYTIILKWFKNSLKCLLTVFCFNFNIRIRPTHSHPKIVVCCQSSRHRDAHTQFARQWFIQFRNSNFPYHANFRVFTHLFCFCFSIRSRAHPTRTNSDLLNI